MNKEALKQILDAMKLHTAETHPLVETERAMEAIETELAKSEREGNPLLVSFLQAMFLTACAWLLAAILVGVLV